MEIFISRKDKVADDIIRLIALDKTVALISIDRPYPDPVKLDRAINSLRFVSILKMYFWDTDDKTMHDKNLLFSSDMKDAVISFIQSMIALKTDVCVINCEKGLHRSTAVACGIKNVFRDKGVNIEIINLPEPHKPNKYVLDFFSL